MKDNTLDIDGLPSDKTPTPSYNKELDKGDDIIITPAKEKAGAGSNDLLNEMATAEVKGEITPTVSTGIHSELDYRKFKDKLGNDFQLNKGEHYLVNAFNDKVQQEQRDHAIKLSEEQGFRGEVGAFLSQVGSEIVFGTLEGVGYLLDFASFTTSGEEHDWNNWLSNAAVQAKDMVRDATPIYLHPDDQGRFAMDSSAWWFSNGVSIASTLSILIPVAGWAKGVSMIGKGMKAANTAGKLGKGAQAAKVAANITKEASKVAAATSKGSSLGKVMIDAVHKGVVSRHIESSMEAAQMYTAEYESLKEQGYSDADAKKHAAAGAAFTYRANWAALATDIPQYLMMGRGLQATKVIHSGKVAKAAGKSPYKALVAKGSNYAKQFASEGIEEAYQFVVSEEGKLLADIDAGLVNADNTDFKGRMSGYLKDSELWTSAFFGGFGGMAIQAMGDAGRSEMGKKLKMSTDKILGKASGLEKYETEVDRRIKEIKTRHTRTSANIKALDETVEAGDERAFQAAKSRIGFELGVNATQVGNFDMAVEDMESLKGLSEEEMAELGYEPGFQADLDLHIANMKRASEIYVKNSNKFDAATVHSISQREYLVEQYGQRAVELKKEMSELTNKIPRINDLSESGQLALNYKLKQLSEKRYLKAAKFRRDQKDTSAEEKAILSADIKSKEELLATEAAEMQPLLDGITDTNDKIALASIDSGLAEELSKVTAETQWVDYFQELNLKQLAEITSPEGQANAKANREKVLSEKKKAAKAAKTRKKTSLEETELDGGLSEEERESTLANNKEELTEYEKWDALSREISTPGSGRTAKDLSAEESAGIAAHNKKKFEKGQQEDNRDPQANHQTTAKSSLNHVPVETPDNITTEEVINPEDLIITDKPTPLAYYSLNNDLREVEATKQRQAITAFLEGQYSVKGIEIHFAIDFDYINEQAAAEKGSGIYSTIKKALDEGTVPDDLVGKIPVKGSLTRNNSPVVHKGEELMLNLHDDTYFEISDPTVKELQIANVLKHKRQVLDAHQAGTTLFTKITGKTDGVLNVKNDRNGKPLKNSIPEQLGKTAAEVQYIYGDSLDSYLNPDGSSNQELTFFTSATPGAIYTIVKTADNNAFPLRAKIENLSMEEGGIIADLYVEILKDGKVLDKSISDALIEKITSHNNSRISGIAKYQELTGMSYKELLNHLVFNGENVTKATSEARLFVERAKTNKAGGYIPTVLVFGKTKMPLNILQSPEGRDKFINHLAEHRRRQVDVKQLQNKKYTEYLGQTNIFHTNAQATPEGNLFVQPVVMYDEDLQYTGEDTAAAKAKPTSSNKEAEIADIEKERQEELKYWEYEGRQEKIKEGRETTKKVITNLKKKYSSTTLQGLVIRLLEKIIDFNSYSIINLEGINLPGNPDKSKIGALAVEEGMAMHQDKIDALLKGEEGAVKTFIHELVHAFTKKKTGEYKHEKSGVIKGFKADLTQKERTALENLERIFEKVKKAFPNSTQYGVTNLDEFLAEAFSNKDFQGDLKSVKTEGKTTSLFKEWLDAVRDLLYSGLESWSKKFNKSIPSKQEVAGILEDVMGWTEDLISGELITHAVTSSEINAKYDAEIAALESTQTTKVEINPYIATANAAVTIRDIDAITDQATAEDKYTEELSELLADKRAEITKTILKEAKDEVATLNEELKETKEELAQVEEAIKNTEVQDTTEEMLKKATETTANLTTNFSEGVKTEVEKQVTEEETTKIAEEEGITEEEATAKVAVEVEAHLQTGKTDEVTKGDSTLTKIVKRISKIIRNGLIALTLYTGVTAYSPAEGTYNLNNTVERTADILSATEATEQYADTFILGMTKLGVYDASKRESTINLDSVTKVKEAVTLEVKEDANAADQAAAKEEYKKANTYFEVLNKIQDSHYKAQKGDNLLSARNQWFNEDGFNYVSGNIQSKTTKGQTVTGVEGVAHFMILDDLGIDLTSKTNDDELKAASMSFQKDRIGKDIKMSDYVPVFNREGNNVNVKYKVASEVTAEDITITRLHQYKFSDIDFNSKTSAKPFGFSGGGVYALTNTAGKGLPNFLFTSSGKDAYSRFSGGSYVLIFKDKQGNEIVHEVSGSINMLKQEGDNLAKTFGVSTDSITLGIYDAGSYSAKPAGKDGVVEMDQYSGYNKLHEHSGGSLMYPTSDNNTKSAGLLGMMLLSPLGLIQRKKKAKDPITPDDTVYQNVTDAPIEDYIASEKTIRDLSARLADRIGLDVRFEAGRDLGYKGKLEGNTAVINLAHATLDTPIHEILGHPIIRAIKNRALNSETSTSELYNNLLEELSTSEKGKEVLDRIKKDYTVKSNNIDILSGTRVSDELYNSIESDEVLIEESDTLNRATYEKRLGNKVYRIQKGEDANVGSAREFSLPTYTLEEQQEEAIVELLGLMTAEKLDNVKDGKLISLLKRLLKEMKSYMKSLFAAKEVNIDSLPDNMTLGDLSDLLAYSNSKIILPGKEVTYTTPDNKTFKTYNEASKHITSLINKAEVDLKAIESQFTPPSTLEGEIDPISKKEIKKAVYNAETLPEFMPDENQWEPGEQASVTIEFKDGTQTGYTIGDLLQATADEALKFYERIAPFKGGLNSFITKNNEYAVSNKAIKEWKEVNSIKYNPEEVYSRGQGFYSVVGAYSEFDVELMFQNLLSHIEDNKKAGGEFTLSAFTRDVNKRLTHIEGNDGKIRFKIFPKPEDIKWAANSDVSSGSVWDASKSVSTNNSELIGVSYTKAPSTRGLRAVKPNLASIIDDINHSHNELGISLSGSNFRLEYDTDNVSTSTKVLIDKINNILDEKYGKLEEPIITDSKEKAGIAPTQTGKNTIPLVEVFNGQNKEDLGVEYYVKTKNSFGIPAPTEAAAIEEHKNDDFYIEGEPFEVVATRKFGKLLKLEEDTTQAQINTKIAALKQGQKKYPRSLIRSRINNIRTAQPESNFTGFEEDELPFQLVPKDKSLENRRNALLEKIDTISNRLTALEEKINSLEGKPTAATVKKVPEERITKVSDLDKKTSDAKELMLALAAKNKKRKPLFKSTTAHNAVSHTPNKKGHEAEIAHINKLLPKEIATRLQADYIAILSDGQIATGVFQDGMITLSEKAELGTAYHEAFHAVFRTLIKSNQRFALIEEAKHQFALPTETELTSLMQNLEVDRAEATSIYYEEQLADEFMAYMDSSKLSKAHYAYSPGIKGLFQKLMDWVKGVFTNKSVGRQLFNDISRSKYATKKPNITRSLAFSARHPLFANAQDVRTVTKQLTYLAFQDVTSLEDVKNNFNAENILLQLSYIVEDTQEVLEANPDNTAAQELQARALSIVPDGKNIDKYWVEKIEEYISTNFNLEKTAKEQVEREEETEDGRLSFLESSYQVSGKVSATNSTKFMIAMTPDIKGYNNGDPVFELDSMLGLPKFNDFSVTYSEVQNLLAGVTAIKDENGEVKDVYDMYIDKLSKEFKYKPHLKHLVDKLNKKSPTVKTEFTFTFSGHRGHYLNDIIAGEAGNITTKIGESDIESKEYTIRGTWAAQFTNNFGIFSEEKNELVYDGVQISEFNDAKARLSQALDTALATKELTNELEDSFMDALSMLGVSITYKTLAKLLDNQGTIGQHTLEHPTKYIIAAFKELDRKLSHATKGLIKKSGTPLFNNNLLMDEDTFFKNELARTAGDFKKISGEDSFIAAEGNKIFPHQNNNSFSKTVNEFKAGELDHLQDLQTTYWGNNSLWLKYLLDDALGAKNRAAFGLALYGNVKREGQGDQGDKAANLKLSDNFMDQVNKQLKGYYIGLAEADKGQQSYMYGPPLKKSMVHTDEKGKLAFTNDNPIPVRVLKRYLADELNRMKGANTAVYGITNEETGEVTPGLLDEEMILNYHYYEVKPGKGKFGEKMDRIEGNAFYSLLFPNLHSMITTKDGQSMTKMEALGLADATGKIMPLTESTFDSNPYVTAYLKQAFLKLVGKDLQTAVDTGVLLDTNGVLTNRLIDSASLADRGGNVVTAIADYTLNSMIGNIEQTKMFNGDPAMFKVKGTNKIGKVDFSTIEVEDVTEKTKIYVKNAKGKLIEDKDVVKLILENRAQRKAEDVEEGDIYPEMFTKKETTWADLDHFGDFRKRIPAASASGKDSRIYKHPSGKQAVRPTYRSATVKDIIRPSSFFGELNEETGKSQFNEENIQRIHKGTGMSVEDLKSLFRPYLETNVTDAQAWITLDTYKERLLSWGKWTAAHSDAYEAMTSKGKIPTPTQVKLLAMPLKTVHNELVKTNNNVMTVHYNKQSEAVLLPTLTRGTQLDTLRIAMENGGLGKGGPDHVIVVDGKKAGGIGITDISDGKGNIIDNPTFNVTDLSYRRLFLQQDLSSKGTKDTTVGSQAAKNVLATIDLDAMYGDLTGRQLVDKYHDVISKLSDLGLGDFKKSIGYTDENGRDEKALRKLLKKEFDTEVSDNHIQAIKDGAPLDSLPIAKKIQNKLHAMLTTKAVKLKQMGGSMVQLSNFGMVGTEIDLTKKVKDGVIWLKKPDTELQPMHFDAEGKVRPAQVLLPHSYLIDKLTKAGYNTKEMTHEELIATIPAEILEGFSYRIPNQGPASNDAFEIVGILPKEAGDTMIAFSAITTKTGSDFDIDKSFIILPEFGVNTETGKLFYIKGDTPTGLKNQRLSLMREMIMHPAAYNMVMTPLDSPWLEDIAKELFPAETNLGDLGFFTGNNQMRTKMVFDNAKALVGSIANHMTHHALALSDELYFKDYYLGKGITRGETNQETSLSNKIDEDGKSIDTTLVAFANAIVDAAKDPFITRANINQFTANTAFMLARGGVSREWSVAFIGQPILIDLVDAMAVKEGRFAVVEKGKNGKPITPLQKVLNKYEYKKGEEGLREESLREKSGTIQIGTAALKSQITSEVDNALQIKVLGQFLEWQGKAKQLNNLVKISKADVNGATKNQTTAKLAENLFEQVIREGAIGNLEKFIGYDMVNGEIEINNTRTTGTYHKNSVTAAREMFKGMFISNAPATETLVDAMAAIAGIPDLLPGQSHELIAGAINDEVTALTMADTDAFRISSAELKEMLFGSTEKASLAERVMRAKKSGVIDNLLLQSLEVRPGFNGAPNSIILPKNDTLKDAKDDLYLAWEDLKGNRLTEGIAKELMTYSYYASGFTGAVGSFHEHIPMSFLAETDFTNNVKHKIAEYSNVDALLPHMDNIFKHLHKMNELVPVVRSEFINTMKTKDDAVVISKEEGFILIADEAVDYIAGADTYGNPVFKRYLKTKDYFVDPFSGRTTETIKLFRLVGTTEAGNGVYARSNKAGYHHAGVKIKEYNNTSKISIFKENNVKIKRGMLPYLNKTLPSSMPVGPYDPNMAREDMNMSQEEATDKLNFCLNI
tara:strand:- start:25831 stop:41877 length:16047 start_codon:yes stop_codon:yes gene_type:complete